MSFQKDASNRHSHSNNSSLRTSNMQNMPSEPLLKSLIRKRSQNQENLTQIKPFKDSKKKVTFSVQNQDGKVLKENKCNKSSTNSKSKMCYCSPTTHEGSFRCRLHRNISTTKKSASEKLSNVRSSKFAHEEIVQFKPQLSRFGRVVSAEYGSQLNSTI
ncbi:uncharacterized protein LOC123892434 [Trifolium pratense]|uniref:uncharacterized protein LOC123892434 n=1 Tax=Trifolium pratense TaxID=57577 RepID=UPI001E695403|nr:uncharacterized protein LOC123892434 [Trifolium pratense]